jgi:hypothetical protein
LLPSSAITRYVFPSFDFENEPLRSPSVQETLKIASNAETGMAFLNELIT